MTNPGRVRTLNDIVRVCLSFVPEDTGYKVKAELLTVTGTPLVQMDFLEGYPTLDRREQVKAVHKV